MQPVPVMIIDGAVAIEQAALQTRDLSEKIFLVRTAPSGWTTVSREVLDRSMKEGKGALTLTSGCRRSACRISIRICHSTRRCVA